MISNDLSRAIQRHWHTAVALSDDLYAHPEIAHQEFRSSQKVMELLRQAGYQVEYPYMGYPTAFRGVLKNGEGPSAAILPDRAELRIEFRTDSLSKLERMDDIVKKCAHGAATAMDCTVNFTKAFDDFADMVRVPVLEDTVEELLHGMGRASEPVRLPNGSSDVGNVSYHCPRHPAPADHRRHILRPAHPGVPGGDHQGARPPGHRRRRQAHRQPDPAHPYRPVLPGAYLSVLSDPA